MYNTSPAVIDPAPQTFVEVQPQTFVEVQPQTKKLFSQDYFNAFLYEQKKNEETTQKGCRAYLKRFAEWLDAQGITQPQHWDIIDYKTYLDGSGLAASTQNQYFRCVKQFFKWTASTGVYDDITYDINAAEVNNYTFKRDILTKEEQATLEQSIDRSTIEGKRLYAFILLGDRRALRVIEMSRLRVKDLSKRGDGVLYLNIWGKGHKEADEMRAVDNDTRLAIGDYLAARGSYDKDSPLFVSTSNRSAGKAIAATTISAMIKRALINAGFNSPRITAHSLRHTAITRAIEYSGNNIEIGKEFARHRNTQTTERYNHAKVIELDAALVQTMENKINDTDDTDQVREDLLEKINKADPAELKKLSQAIAQTESV